MQQNLKVTKLIVNELVKKLDTFYKHGKQQKTNNMVKSFKQLICYSYFY